MNRRNNNCSGYKRNQKIDFGSTERFKSVPSWAFVPTACICESNTPWEAPRTANVMNGKEAQ
ncbi:MAG: hypothetical protein IPL98_16315 [Saprospiraceae bacterium]|nr:hypothetical protein [Saprospiraceae bacterium]